jgi:hypothetical protein
MIRMNPVLPNASCAAVLFYAMMGIVLVTGAPHE